MDYYDYLYDVVGCFCSKEGEILDRFHYEAKKCEIPGEFQGKPFVHFQHGTFFTKGS